MALNAGMRVSHTFAPAVATRNTVESAKKMNAERASVSPLPAIAAAGAEDVRNEALALMTRMLVAARLLAPDVDEPPPAAAAALAEACGHPDLPSLLLAFADARQEVAGAWADSFGQPLETA